MQWLRRFLSGRGEVQISCSGSDAKPPFEKLASQGLCFFEGTLFRLVERETGFTYFGAPLKSKQPNRFFPRPRVLRQARAEERPSELARTSLGVRVLEGGYPAFLAMENEEYPPESVIVERRRRSKAIQKSPPPNQTGSVHFHVCTTCFT